MNSYRDTFAQLLEDENRYKCIKYAHKLLDEEKIGIVDLYQKIVIPALRNITCKLDEKSMCIWQEHVRSGIVRTVVESCYPYVVDESAVVGEKNKGRVVLLCPEEEYYDLGARMISDFFTISGYEAIFVGSNTPTADFLAAVKHIRPDYIIITVTNYYNLFAAKKAIEHIREKAKNNIKIVVSGDVFKSNKNDYKRIGADFIIETFEDIQELGGA